MPADKDDKAGGAAGDAGKSKEGGDAGTAKDGSAKSGAAAAQKELTAYDRLVKNVATVEKSIKDSDSVLMLRALRHTSEFRRSATAADLKKGLETLVVESPRRDQLLRWVDDVVEAEGKAGAADVDMEASGDSKGATGGDEDADMGESAAQGKGESESKTSVKQSDAPEVEAYLQTIVMQFLHRHELDEQCLACAMDLARHGGALNKRSLDWFTSKAYAYMAMSHEKLGSMAAVRSHLIAAHRTACLRHDKVGQATLLNLMLRNYLHFNLYSQAAQLLGRAAFPEEVSNNQYVRYLYYRSRIRAVRLEYVDAAADLEQALRKTPTNTAVGFRRTVQKLAIVVTLLLGELPKRTIFNEPSLRSALKPYFEITAAVHAGDVAAFNKVVTERGEKFSADGNLTLIGRLRHNVIKAGLRQISTSYSRISFDDVAEKLLLDSAEDAEFLCAKAIRDGVIDATLLHDAGHLLTTESTDLYATTAPQEAFQQRIQFCLDVRNDAVKSMRYPAVEPAKDEPDIPIVVEVSESVVADLEDEEDDEGPL